MLVFTQEVRGQESSVSDYVDVEYDKFEDSTSLITKSVKKETKEGDYYLFYLLKQGDGKEVPTVKETGANLIISYIGSEWRHLESNAVYFLIDGNNRFSLDLIDSSRDNSAYSVTETLLYHLGPAEFEMLLNAKSYDIRIGGNEIVNPPPELLDAIRALNAFSEREDKFQSVADERYQALLDRIGQDYWCAQDSDVQNGEFFEIGANGSPVYSSKKRKNRSLLGSVDPGEVVIVRDGRQRSFTKICYKGGFAWIDSGVLRSVRP